MATDLVRWGGWDDDTDGREPDTYDTADQWDRPPQAEENKGTARRGKRGGSAQVADQDAASARKRGDGTFAVERETDAAEHRQSAWDWGDARTWLIIGAMCLGFVLLSLSVYFLPHGRHNQNDGPAPTPTIRVY